MGKPIRDVTIVGGGTAGWLAASALARAFAMPGKVPPLKITLIESPSIPPIGVGEASLPSLHALIEFLGIDEREFVRRTNAAFKLGGRFVNWNHGPNGEPVDFLNIMNRPPDGVAGTVADLFLAFHPERDRPNAGREYARMVSPAVDLVDGYLGPFSAHKGPQSASVGYSYHFDAGELAKMMKARSIEMGTTHILDDVDDVEQDENGLITALKLRQHGRHAVQLVIDCTGFQSVLLGRQMDVPFESYERFLLNDRALVVQVPHADPTRIEPVTRLTGLESGWSFEVPLFNRVGTGYVFSSRFSSDDQALAEMTRHLGPRIEQGTPKFIPMKLGHRKRHWAGNVVAMGLSSGFIEPLEATAIYMVQFGVNMLIKSWPTQDYEPELAQRFDRRMNRLYDEIRDFVACHFYLNNRTDSAYWTAAREAVEIPDSLRQNLELWKQTLPATEDMQSQQVFAYNVYTLAYSPPGRLSLLACAIACKQKTISKPGLPGRSLPDERQRFFDEKLYSLYRCAHCAGIDHADAERSDASGRGSPRCCGA
ncbi:MAG: tryptophan 7-halogenase [Xanthomonadaceae bacterium]|nr:tryptophan 7-halogenase [Xanthomonadaceae bacterium]